MLRRKGEKSNRSYVACLPNPVDESLTFSTSTSIENFYPENLGFHFFLEFFKNIEYERIFNVNLFLRSRRNGPLQIVSPREDHVARELNRRNPHEIPRNEYLGVIECVVKPLGGSPSPWPRVYVYKIKG